MDRTQDRLTNGLRAGDKKVFEEIYHLYFVPLSYYCAAYTGTMEDAEEVVQSVFLKLWVKRNEIIIETSLKAYLYKAVQNEAINMLNHNKVKKKYESHIERLTKNTNENVQHKMEKEELERIIKRAMLRLPKKRRKIFEMSRFEGLKYTEIAERLSLSVKTVEAQMSKALKSLRKSLKDYVP